jgi:hypothetical protein
MQSYDSGFKDGSFAGYKLAIDDMKSENKPFMMRKLMGEFYEFDARIIDGNIVYGFVYRNKNTGWNDVFVEFDESQKTEADKLTAEMDLVREKQSEFLKMIVSA